ncbi:hypothetical protein CMI47_17050 [Candidatus Pacearchaeota archaeon]|nr:hypothetical protein [Candidatus Pacearchaeota archaeon]|tara:strand:- start:3991 stop:4359 length:369 start_codon:yes stop_codon:yes gene_type:complete
MASFGVALPLERNSDDGYMMIRNIRKLIKQNLKMLILTNPGERIMVPEFGVGIKRYLFENYGQGTEGAINKKIKEQVKIYLPVVSIVQISFGTADRDNNRLGVSIAYAIPEIGAKDLLEFTI